MTRGRKPTPTGLKLVTGNPGRRPINHGEPIIEANETPKPPAHITGIARTEWDRVAPVLFNCGVLTELDVMALAVYCQSFSIYVQALDAIDAFGKKEKLVCELLVKTTSGTLKQNPLVGIANKAAADMVRYATEFGMTPSSRTKLDMNKSTPSNSTAAKYLS